MHVCTAHFATARWLALQQRQLDRFAAGEYRVWRSCEGIPEEDLRGYDVASRQGGSHAQKLNELSTLVLTAASDEDLVVFLDGDAFPVVPLAPRLEGLLDQGPLVAVRRHENAEEHYPHPLFCASTVSFWRDIGGDWSEGFFETAVGRRFDVGGLLQERLSRAGVSWVPLLRTNRFDLHPLWFAVYGDLVYHHGASFRKDPLSRLDRTAQPGDHGALASVAKRNARLIESRRIELEADPDGFIGRLRGTDERGGPGWRHVTSYAYPARYR